jgi:hypothetical protein
MHSRLLLATIAIVIASPALAAPAAPAKYSCAPAKDGKKLQSLEVFDGPVADNASLVPDDSNQNNGTWTFDGTYEDGRFITLRCKYAGGAVVDIEMKDKVKSCRSKTAGKVLSVSCD